MMSRRISIILAGALLLLVATVAVTFYFRNRPDSIDDKKPIVEEPARYKIPLVISVQTLFPGANAQTVADTVAGPIEEQVNGVEHMLSMSSLSTNEGSYTLQITFEPGTDLDRAQMLVQNRVSLALPVLPGSVQQGSITVRKKSPEPLVLISLTSPDHRYDVLYLSNYATIHVKNELARLPGVGDIGLFGQCDYQMRVWLDPDKLAMLQLSAMDVVTALSQQNIQVSAGPIGQDPPPKGQKLQLILNTSGRLTESEQLESVIVKATSEGRLVRLKDVARLELGLTERSHANLNGKAAVLLSVYPLPNAKPSEVSRAVLDKIRELLANVPDGLALAVAFDFAPNLEQPNNPATPEYLVIDVSLPESASAERTVQTLERATELLRKTPGVLEVLALSDHPFSLVRNRPCLVVRMTPKDQRELDREQIAAKVREALQNQVVEASFRLSLPSTGEGFPVYGFPVEFAIEDRGGHGYAALWEGADALVAKMSQSGKFSDVGVSSGLQNVPVLNIEVDRTKCQTLGVEITDIFKSLQVYLGSYSVNNFNQFGRTWKMEVPVDSRFRDRNSDILKLQVKNKMNQMIPLGTVMTVREAMGPMVIERHNLYPIARITANLAKGVPLAEAKSLCETLAKQEFGTKKLKLVWRTR